jgi:hypothetical protein
VAAREKGQEVVLRRAAEARPGEVRVQGWAVTERGVQLFTREVAANVRPLSLRVADHEMRAATGPYGLEGFEFAFRLVPNGPQVGDVE